MSSDEILKAVFPLLEGADLAACTAVCKQWRNIARDDYFWKCLCAKKWPSTYGNLLFSQVVPGPALRKGNWTPPAGVIPVMKFHLEGPEYKLTLPVEPQFAVPYTQTISVSVLVARKDTKKVACIIHEAMFDYIDRSTCRALAFNYLVFSPAYPFVSGIRAWIALLFMDGGKDDDINVFGLEIDFCDAANSEEEVLWLLDMLDWK
ncbi:F-box protein At5g39250 isoform X2 [Cynara cardunculus var. scolymus]|uniref:F-box protein At5g39250 isoform X2 n=1 Tax=Cynara cardunculus var. scolymus TaxID=59895 RepID=UPI000D629F13|nr:F-box protein At5g39250 isoform X2 [Cynara cardunculus var. scolymus]